MDSNTTAFEMSNLENSLHKINLLFINEVLLTYTNICYTLLAKNNEMRLKMLVE